MTYALKYRFPIPGYIFVLRISSQKNEIFTPVSPDFKPSSRTCSKRTKHYIFPHRSVNIFPVIAAQCPAQRGPFTPARLEFRRPARGGGNDESRFELSTDILINEELLRKQRYREKKKRLREELWSALRICCVTKRLTARVLRAASQLYNRR